MIRRRCTERNCKNGRRCLEHLHFDVMRRGTEPLRFQQSAPVRTAHRLFMAAMTRAPHCARVPCREHLE